MLLANCGIKCPLCGCPFLIRTRTKTAEAYRPWKDETGEWFNGPANETIQTRCEACDWIETVHKERGKVKETLPELFHIAEGGWIIYLDRMVYQLNAYDKRNGIHMGFGDLFDELPTDSQRVSFERRARAAFNLESK